MQNLGVIFSSFTIGRELPDHRLSPTEAALQEKSGSLRLAAEPPLTRTELLRRVVLVCCNFTRNLAFYRVSLSVEAMPLLSKQHPQCSFWRQVHCNFFDTCILDWFKLLGDKRSGKHYWSRVVSDTRSFEESLLRHLGMSVVVFESYAAEILKYRHKFVAHLDSLRGMYIPQMDTAQESIWFYYGHVVTHEANAADLRGLPSTAEELKVGYEQSRKEAQAAYAAALPPHGVPQAEI